MADGSTAYLAILMDIYTRMIRGWSLRRDLTESLVHEALSKALQTGHIPGIHHSDQGVQYTANGYDCKLLELDVKISMAGKGRAWENPFAESVIGHLKDKYGLRNMLISVMPIQICVIFLMFFIIMSGFIHRWVT